MTSRKHYRSLFYISSLTLLVSACNYLPVSNEHTESPVITTSDSHERSSVIHPSENEAPRLTTERTAHQPKQQQIIEIGSGEFIATPKQRLSRHSEVSDGDITLNFQDTDLREFIKVILSDVLDSSYVIDPKVAGKVTLETARPFSKEELIPLLEDILGMNNAALVETDNLYRILPKNQAVAGNLAPEFIEKEKPGGYAVRIIPLRFIAAQEMQKILDPFVVDNKDIRIDKRRNLVIASGSPQEITLIQETIDVFDVDWLRGMSVGLYPLDYVDPKTMKSELDSIMNGMQGNGSQELLDGLVRTVSLERLNSILLIGSTATALREVEIWLHRLDRPGEHVGQRLYVYDVQNAKATEIGDILNQIFSTSITTASTLRAAELAPGLTSVDIGTDIRDVSNTTRDPKARSTTGNNASESGIVLPNSKSISIIADDVRNALVVLATPQDYKMVAEAIRKLDVVPLQVLIEASILEVSLRDDLSYGVEWFFKNGIKDKKGRGTLDLGDSGLSALSPGFSFTIVDAADQVRVALNALQNESEVNVLSSPSLMVLNNQTAMINVGDEIPVPTRQSISNIDPASPTVNEIQFRQTGITLTVTPRVNSSGLVTMEIKQEVSTAISTTSSNIDAPTIQQRQIESVVAINSGETIVLGGLIQNTKTENESGIPFLHKIPILGKLFGQTGNENRRTELLVLITPRVIRNRNEARSITNEFRSKLRGLAPADIKLLPEEEAS